MKKKLDELRAKYEVEDFIKNDPIQFPKRFKTLEDIELAGFLASGFAYGKREVFIKKLNILFAIMQNEPLNFILDIKSQEHKLNGFMYRFIKDFDLIAILKILSEIYSSKSNLRELFQKSKKEFNSAQGVANYFYAKCPKTVSAGFYHFLPNPVKGGAMKRVHMFLRWMVRDGKVDIGAWDIYKKSELFIPLDVHAGNISREFGLLKRTSNDKKAVIELTNKLKEFDPNDPIKYDFALFGLGVNR